jgi:hypothetical protein
MKYKITKEDLRTWSAEDQEATGYSVRQILADGLVANESGEVFFQDGVRPTPPWTLGHPPLAAANGGQL